MAEKKECEKSQNIVDEASEKEKKESLNQEPEVSEETGSEEGGEEGEADEAARLSAELETLKATIEKMQKDYLLLMAEFDNFRKRTLREKSELIKNGGENCMKAILPVIDDFERGLAAVEESNDLAAVKEGIIIGYGHGFGEPFQQNRFGIISAVIFSAFAGPQWLRMVEKPSIAIECLQIKLPHCFNILQRHSGGHIFVLQPLPLSVKFFLFLCVIKSHFCDLL